MEEARRDHVTIEVDRLANEFENMMNSIDLTMSPQRCIFKVPNILLRHNEKAYVPDAFSIGPYHYGKEHLQAAEKIKLRYLHDLIANSQDDPQTILSTLIGAIRHVQQEARDCYSDPIDIITDEFVKILVLDGCFLLELFHKNMDKTRKKDDDPVFSRRCMLQILGHDLILLENQIPWLVLQRLFDNTRKREDPQCGNLSTMVQKYFRDTCFFTNLHSPALISKENENKHILDMLRKLLFPSSNGTKNKRNIPYWQMSMPSATRLRDAGIKFEKVTSSKTNLDIEFDQDGVLKIPPLPIDEVTESFFRNLICLEQYLPYTQEVTSYAILLDNLINSTEDMEILRQNGIINSWLNIDDAVDFFNQLYDDAYVESYYYKDLVKNVNEFCGHKWPRYRTALKRDYFKHPWALMSVIAASLLLILTALQTVFTIIQYIHM